MDKKRLIKNMTPEELKGFEEFIDAQPEGSSFLPKGNNPKKEVSFEHFTFLTNDSERLLKIKNLLSKKLPFSVKFNQGKTLLFDQEQDLKKLRERLFLDADQTGSAFQRSFSEIFDSYFNPPQS